MYHESKYGIVVGNTYYPKNTATIWIESVLIFLKLKRPFE